VCSALLTSRSRIVAAAAVGGEPVLVHG